MSSKANKKVDTKKPIKVTINIEDTRKLSDESKKNKNIDFDNACDLAFYEIMKDHEIIIKKAANQGKSSAYLYIWEFTEHDDKESYCFNGFRIMTLLKGGLLDRFKEIFSPSGYFVGFKKFNKKDDEDVSRYGLFVSWRIIKDKDNNEKKK